MGQNEEVKEEVVTTMADGQPAKDSLPDQEVIGDEKSAFQEMADKAASKTQDEEVVDETVKADESSTQEEAEPEWTPNPVYKVYDEEREFPDWAKELVKSKDLEDQVRTLLSKADAFDPLKEKYEKRGASVEEVSKEKEELAQKYEQIVDRLTEFDHYLDNDLGLFFQKIGIPDEKILDYVKDYIRVQELPEQDRLRINQGRQALEQNWQNQRQSTLLQQQQYNLAKERHESEYERVLSMPEVGNFQKAFDERLGAGAFREHADNYGRMYHQQHGQDTTPLDAVNYVMQKYSGLVGQASSTDSVEQAKNLTREREDNKPGGHIPNVGKGAGSSSPVAKRFQSIDELKKHIASMSG